MSVPSPPCMVAPVPRLAILTLIGAALLIVFGSALAQSMPDITDQSVLTAVETLRKTDAIRGYPDGTFKPERLVTRGEFLKVLVHTLLEADQIPGTRNDCFADQKHSTEWYWAYACYGKDEGIVRGDMRGNFHGGRHVNLAEALKMTLSAFDVSLPDYIKAPDHWYDPYFDAIADMPELAFLPRDPGHLVTRGEMARIIYAVAVSQDALTPDTTSSSSSSVTLGTKCVHSDSCANDEYCTTEDGDCQSLCEPGVPCVKVCAGICKPRGKGSQQCAADRNALNEALTKSYSCRTDSDCAMVEQSCPYITCGAAVSATIADSLQSQLRAHVDICPINACADCMAQKAVCQSGTCKAVPR